ncbi:MAG TPA: anti-sigma factor [Candidatus Limnocylindrales bacterium]|nr:anti-sigma factor [Candidatus Limnocylindrales bacterium]
MSGPGRLNCVDAAERAALYVLGALEPSEMAAVRQHLAECPEPHAEFAALGGVVPYLAELPEAVEPPASLDDRVAAAVEADVRARQRDESAAERLVSRMGEARPAALSTPVEPAPPPQAPAPLSAPSRTLLRRWRPLLEFAAVLVIGALLGWNLVLQGQLGEAGRRSAELREAAEALAHPNAVIARIAGTAAAPGVSGFAVLRGSGDATRAVVVVSGLPAAPAGKTYEAWYVRGETAVPAGLVSVGGDGLIVASLPDGPPPDAVALSLEDLPGTQVPTKVVALGKVGS